MSQAPPHPKVSVLIPMWNEERNVARTLDSLSAQDYDGEIEVVVADGGSTDGSTEIVRRHRQNAGPRITIVLKRNPSRNTAVGRNVCLRASSGEIVVNWSAHAVAPPDLVAVLVRKLWAAAPEVAAVGAANVAPEDDSFPARVIAVVYASLLGGVRSVDQNALYAEDRELPSVAFAAYRTDVVKRVGGFDETLWVGEDFELNFRIRKAGYQILFTPETVGYRFNRRTLRAFWRQMFRYGIARCLVMRIHPDSIRPAYLMPALFFLYVTAGLATSLAVPRLLPWYAGSLALYAVFGWISSLLVSRDPKLVAASPVYYFAIHFGYGAGFVRAILGGRLW